MLINTIRNNTGGVLELWDVGTQLATLQNGQAVHNLPITITSISFNTVGYHNKMGAFMNGDSYSATLVLGIPPNPTSVMFTGNTNKVFFS